MTDAPRIVLHQFLYSHFNEKARWGLDWKGLPHHRENYLPGPHAPQIKRLAGDTTVPVLEIDGSFVQGSAKILDVLEERFPDRALYPKDAAERTRALEIQREFDREVGPAARAAFFSCALAHGRYLCDLFAADRGVWTRGAYRTLFPVAKAVISRSYGIHDPATVAEAFRRTEQALDFVAQTASPAGPLVGDRFSVADLTAAALLAIAADPDHPDMKRPEPHPDGVRAFLQRFADHPGSAWVRSQYAEHRPAPRAI